MAITRKQPRRRRGDAVSPILQAILTLLQRKTKQYFPLEYGLVVTSSESKARKYK